MTFVLDEPAMPTSAGPNPDGSEAVPTTMPLMDRTSDVGACPRQSSLR